MRTLAPDFEDEFPSLRQSRYKVTSCKEPRYNCIAWAAAYDKKRWWEPRDENGIFWPDEVPKNYDYGSFVKLFEFLGYTICTNSRHEMGYEKIAIYKEPTTQWFTHVARQLRSGRWTSKLGPDEDIKHRTPEALAGQFYGEVDVIMARRYSIGTTICQMPFFLLGKLRKNSQ